jgi:hypothetical protein
MICAANSQRGICFVWLICVLFPFLIL